MRHGTPLMGLKNLHQCGRNCPRTALQSNPPFCLLSITGVSPAFHWRLCHFSGSFSSSLTGVSPNKSLAGLNSSYGCFSGNLSSHTHGLKQCLMTKWWAQVHTGKQTTDPELELRSLVPPSKALYTLITYHLKNMSLMPVSRRLLVWWLWRENDSLMAKPHSWLLSSVYNYVDFSGCKNICLRFRENWSYGLGQWRKSGLRLS